MTAAALTLTARWLFPVDGPPLERGTITIAGERIAAVEPHGVRAADVDLGNVAVLPGFVNAHTHLDLGALHGKCPPTPDFTAWLRQVIAHRRAALPDIPAYTIHEGLAQSIRHGTTLLGDIEGGPTNLFRGAADLRLVIFKELLGLPRERVQPAWEAGVTWLHRHLKQKLPADVRVGLSPHAPYSVHRLLFRHAAARSREANVPIAVHLAETRAELVLLEKRTGPFVSFLTDLGVWHEDGLIAAPQQVVELFADAGPTLLVHCNYLDPNAPIPGNASVVYCPRTHAAFGHPPHPFREFLARGVRVALGTDSLASNPDLDVLAEARFVHARYGDVPGGALLRMLTLSGAEALGWADETGSLTPGKSADLVVLPLPDEDCADPHTLIFESAQSVQSVMFRGRWTVGQH